MSNQQKNTPPPAHAQNGNGNGNGQMVTFNQRVATFRGTLEKLKPQIALALPKHVKADRLARIVLTSVQKTPDLLACTQESLLGCVIQAAQLGLEPDGMLGHAYLIPYKNKGVMTCQLLVGYKGMLKLARQSGEIASISAHVVYSKDDFEFGFGLDETLSHRPATPPLVMQKNEETGDEFEIVDPSWDPGTIIAAYAVAKLKDGTKQFDVMYRYEIESVRERSKAATSGPWVTDFPEMAKKTVLRRLCKMLPASVELQTAVALDERADAGVGQELENVIDIAVADPNATIEVENPPGELKKFESPKSDLDALAEQKRKEREHGGDPPSK